MVENEHKQLQLDEGTLTFILNIACRDANTALAEEVLFFAHSGLLLNMSGHLVCDPLMASVVVCGVLPCHTSGVEGYGRFGSGTVNGILQCLGGHLCQEGNAGHFFPCHHAHVLRGT